MSHIREYTHQRVWRFLCPQCGFGDQELGQLATAEEIHCEVCMMALDGPHLVVLRRWHADEPSDDWDAD